MNTILIIALVVLMIFVVISLVRGLIAFLKTTKLDLESGQAEQIREMQLLQNRMMVKRIMYQGAAIVVVAIILAMAK